MNSIMSDKWPSRQGLKPGSHNVLSHPLVEPSKILLPPLHIKLGLMKNFVKALDREGRRFASFHQKFQQKSMEKIKAGIFDDPQIRELIKGSSFDDALNPAELSAWFSLQSVIANFLGNHRNSQYRKVVDELMENFRPGECFHQDMTDIETGYQGLWDVNFLADYCWYLKTQCWRICAWKH